MCYHPWFFRYVVNLHLFFVGKVNMSILCGERVDGTLEPCVQGKSDVAYIQAISDVRLVDVAAPLIGILRIV